MRLGRLRGWCARQAPSWQTHRAAFGPGNMLAKMGQVASQVGGAGAGGEMPMRANDAMTRCCCAANSGGIPNCCQFSMSMPAGLRVVSTAAVPPPSSHLCQQIQDRPHPGCRSSPRRPARKKPEPCPRAVNFAQGGQISIDLRAAKPYCPASICAVHR